MDWETVAKWVWGVRVRDLVVLGMIEKEVIEKKMDIYRGVG